MIVSDNTHRLILDILSKKYNLEIIKDELLELSDETHLCVEIKNSQIDINGIREEISSLDLRVIKYGNMLAFCKN